MDIRIDKTSEVPLHEQVAAQIVYLIGTGRLKAGTPLPSVRALAMRLGIHRNTISRAYHDLTLNMLVAKRAGTRLVVTTPESAAPADANDLDALISTAINEARRRGYSLQQLHARMLKRLRCTPVDRVLVVANDTGTRMLLPEELKERVACPVEACTPAELTRSPERGLAALVVSPQGYVPAIRAILPAETQVIPITYAAADNALETIAALEAPSLISLVSVSPYFLEVARGVLAPVVGHRHALHSRLV